ncbi:fucose isomerase [Roseivivax sediminis]|nr:fucose isomerase [Roseivivax sediminis]
MEEKLSRAVSDAGCSIRRGHPATDAGHGFLASQREGMDAFADIDPEAPVIIAIAAWQYSHHVVPGLLLHKGPILTVANWQGKWPGLVGMLNLNGSLTAMGRDYSTLWSETFDDDFFREGLRTWLETGHLEHDLSHVRAFHPSWAESGLRETAARIAGDLKRNKAILGVFDEGCMGMMNAMIPDHLLAPLGLFKERLSQSALYHETQQVDPAHAEAALEWLEDRGMTFHFGSDPETELTREQVIEQLRLYVAAARIADDFGCEAIGIQYQQGLKDLLPASDLAEGLFNNDERPIAPDRNGVPIREGRSIPHFNEVDECAGVDAILTDRVHRALGEPAETTLHDVRWGAEDPTGTVDGFVWVFEISGATPPAHHEGGFAGTESHRQPPMYFRLGGGTVTGVAKSGHLVWSRVYVADGGLHMDIGTGRAVSLPAAESRRRRDSTTPQWPIMHAVLDGQGRDALMARHKANHIQVAYGSDADGARNAALAKACLAAELGMTVHWCGTQPL